jgi:hypothetical protein
MEDKIKECIVCFQSEINNLASFGFNDYLFDINNMLNYFSNHIDKEVFITMRIKEIVENKLKILPRDEYKLIEESFTCYVEELKKLKNSNI